MKSIPHQQMTFVYQQPTIYSRVAEFSFYLMAAFVLFGTAMPFPETEGFNEENTSNIYNQIIFSFILFSGTFSLIPLRIEAWAVLRREKLLIVLLAWCAISLTWSVYPFVGFKRLVLLSAVSVSSLAVLLHSRNRPNLLTRLKYVVAAYILLTIVVCLALPAAKDPKFYTWRGFEPTKNNLGQVALVCILLLFVTFKSEQGKRYFSGVLLALSGAVLIGSWSVTSIGVLFGLLGIGLLVWAIDVAFNSAPIARLLSIVAIAGFALLALGAMLWAPELLTTIPKSLGKDITFSGRTYLWESMWLEIERHWMLGTGYAGFWNPESIGMEVLHEEFVWLPNQAHNGYLDVLNEIGLVGLFLFAALIIRYLRDAVELGEGFYWQWFIVAMLVMNLQESTFLRPHNAFNVFFLFAYFSLFVEQHFRELRRFGADDKLISPN